MQIPFTSRDQANELLGAGKEHYDVQRKLLKYFEGEPYTVELPSGELYAANTFTVRGDGILFAMCNVDKDKFAERGCSIHKRCDGNCDAMTTKYERIELLYPTTIDVDDEGNVTLLKGDTKHYGG